MGPRTEELPLVAAADGATLAATGSLGAGPGMMTLAAVNTYTGLTAVQAGTLFGTGLVAGSVSVADAERQSHSPIR